MSDDELKCTKCDRVFGRKYELFRHQKTSKKCSSKSNKKNMFSCQYCKERFKRKDVLTKHMKSCKKKSKKIAKNSHNKTTDNSNVDNSKPDNSTNTATMGNRNNSNKINNNCTINKEGDINVDKINNFNNFNLFMFGKDGYESISPSVMNKLMNSKRSPHETLTESVNFDPKKPQHHNVYCSDLKSGVGYIYENDRWVTKCLDEVLDMLVDSKTSDMIEMLEIGINYLSDMAKHKLRRAIDEARGVVIGYDGRTYPPGSRNRLKRYMKHIIYNNREMVLDTKRKMSMKPRKCHYCRPDEDLYEDSIEDSIEDFIEDSEGDSEGDIRYECNDATFDDITFDDLTNANDDYEEI